MTVAQVRYYIPDHPQTDLVQVTQEDGSVRFALPYFPVVADSYTVSVNGVEQTETTDYTINLLTGAITFTSAPANGAAIRVDYQHTLLTDAAIEQFLSVQGDNVKRAAADACEVIGRDTLIVHKVVRMMDMTTDGAAVSREFRQAAKALRDQAEDEEYDGSIAVIEMVTNPFGYREKVWNAYRQGAV